MGPTRQAHPEGRGRSIEVRRVPGEAAGGPARAERPGAEQEVRAERVHGSFCREMLGWSEDSMEKSLTQNRLFQD